ncbi:TPA: hypothetical protein L9K47_004700 [Klebsiella quasipneumoniae subsp. similipneumoniae]|nr:hypothetical protein [Escherichia coli]HBU5893125.1 hypothetical protein [Klebsiella quasipneumoniae subsp. similipneumoniae]
MKLFDSLTLGSALSLVGVILMASAGAAESGNIIQEAINAFLDNTNPFHSIAALGFSLTLLGALLLAYWILFGGPPSKSDKSKQTK